MDISSLTVWSKQGRHWWDGRFIRLVRGNNSVVSESVFFVFYIYLFFHFSIQSITQKPVEAASLTQPGSIASGFIKISLTYHQIPLHRGIGHLQKALEVSIAFGIC